MTNEIRNPKSEIRNPKGQNATVPPSDDYRLSPFDIRHSPFILSFFGRRPLIVTQAGSGFGEGQHGRVLKNVMPVGHRRLQRAEWPECHPRTIGVKLLWTIGKIRVQHRLPLHLSAAVSGLAA